MPYDDELEEDNKAAKDLKSKHLRIEAAIEYLSKMSYKKLDFSPKEDQDGQKPEYFITTEEVKVIAEAIAANKKLTSVNLGWNNISSAGAIIIFETLLTNHTLNEIDLSGGNFSDEAIKLFVNVIQINKTLKVVRLEMGGISDEQGVLIAKALEFNNTLTLLEMDNNRLGDATAIELAKTLTTNTSLTMLNLRFNSIGDKGALALADSLKTNRTLTNLDLLGNVIGDNGVKEFAAAIKDNFSILSLNLRLHNINKIDYKSSYVREIKQLLRRNHAFGEEYRRNNYITHSEGNAPHQFFLTPEMISIVSGYISKEEHRDWQDRIFQEVLKAGNKMSEAGMEVEERVVRILVNKYQKREEREKRIENRNTIDREQLIKVLKEARLKIENSENEIKSEEYNSVDVHVAGYPKYDFEKQRTIKKLNNLKIQNLTPSDSADESKDKTDLSLSKKCSSTASASDSEDESKDTENSSSKRKPSTSPTLPPPSLRRGAKLSKKISECTIS